MKKINLLITFAIVCLLLFSTQTKAQQVFQLTQYMLNEFAYNPAVAGSYDNFITKVGFRKQWTGLDGSPSTFLLSANGNFSQKKSIGVGAMLYSDNTGPTRRTGINLAYAYHLPLNLEGNMHLGFGVSANVMQYAINFSELNPAQTGDPSLGSSSENKIGADANLGIFLKAESFSVGISANQLFASKFKFLGNPETVQNARHIYLSGNYNYNINDKFGLQPGLLLKMVKGTSPQAEINLKGIYDKKYWLGLSYRTEDALAILVGLQLPMGFNFAYSYDITTSGLNAVSNGAHEISIGYDFNIFQ